MRFKDQVVLITGAARGIGWGIAKRFAKEGARVVLNDVESDLLEDRFETLSRQAVDALKVCADVSIWSEVKQMIHTVLKRYGQLDVLVNNAVVFNGSTPILEIQEADWCRVMNVNLNGVFNCGKAAATHMVERRKGRIVNITSLVGKLGRVVFGSPGKATWASYAASKAAIISLTKSMAFEWAPYNIHVNAVAPSYVKTEKTTPEMEKELAVLYPLGRIAQPADVANAVLFLASEEASFITGEILDVNGGVYMD
ncbi:MAG: SDR family oxidoreductase [Deltaproteobacteria bacterium]|nr:SDR family oxidoreductase [Deltaproteobacteria bacterium]MBW2152583.1 SDR family oxidoreductase [Deltaproteobacteria bacterium]